MNNNLKILGKIVSPALLVLVGVFLFTSLANVLFPVQFAVKTVSAHEVYVLSAEEVQSDLQETSLPIGQVLVDHSLQFLGAAVTGIILIVIIFLISVSGSLKRWIGPGLLKIKPWAKVLCQVTLGISLIMSGYHGAFFGTELPIVGLFPGAVLVWQVVLLILGGVITLGIFVRPATLLFIGLFAYLTFQHGVYMVSYGTYLGEAIIVLLFGGYTLFGKHFGKKFNQSLPKKSKIIEALRPYHFLILRVALGGSLIFADFYAKWIHGSLALDTVIKYNLSNYFFHMDPKFIVLGAFCVEILIGLFFLLGFELRFTAIFFSIFITLSLLFFKEAVWPHFMFFGTALTIFMSGYDRYTIMKYLPGGRKGEPVL